MQRMLWSGGAFICAAALAVAGTGCDAASAAAARTDGEALGEVSRRGQAAGDPALQSADRFVRDGRQIFRFDTFGDEAFWSDTLLLNRAIAGAPNGGVGPGLSPAAALGLGLKVDVDALPAQLKARLRQGRVDLADPATTLALIDLDSVVGVKAAPTPAGQPRRIGITCALCHSTVDDSFAPGIGKRLDGWPNRDLDVGQVIAFSPSVQPFADLLQVDQDTVRAVLRSWGPGRFDAALLLDGKAFRPDGGSGATVLPAAFGLAGVNLHTYTGWGGVAHWNAFVANLEMQGSGRFFDPRLDSPQFPVAQRAGLANVFPRPGQGDLVTGKLAPLQMYQLSLEAPQPPAGSFDPAKAERGRQVFEAHCARCHVPPLYTEPGWNMHTPEEIGIDAFQSDRSPDRRYRTTPLKGLFTRAKGGFYHDGRFPDVGAVVDHYAKFLSIQFEGSEREDLVEFLRSL